MNFMGLNIIEHPLMPSTQPRMKLKHDVPVSDKFRAEFDQWLLEFFGTERVAYMFDPKEMYYAVDFGREPSLVYNRFLAVSPENFAVIRDFES